MLHEEFLLCGLNWIPKPMIDTYTIMSKSSTRTLEGAYKFYCDGEIKSAHDALGDVYTTIDVLRGQIDMYEFKKISENDCNKYESSNDFFEIFFQG